jgi:hypothetical protein
MSRQEGGSGPPFSGPPFYDDVRIQGKLIGVIRRLD